MVHGLAVGHHLSGTGLHVLRARLRRIAALRAWHAAADSMRVGLGMIATPAAAPAAASPASEALSMLRDGVGGSLIEFSTIVRVLLLLRLRWQAPTKPDYTHYTMF